MLLVLNILYFENVAYPQVYNLQNWQKHELTPKKFNHSFLVHYLSNEGKSQDELFFHWNNFFEWLIFHHKTTITIFLLLHSHKVKIMSTHSTHF
jgi:hypothetical protein